jgi:tetratricopeptide (TPR) repeat protein
MQYVLLCIRLLSGALFALLLGLGGLATQAVAQNAHQSNLVATNLYQSAQTMRAYQQRSDAVIRDLRNVAEQRRARITTLQSEIKASSARGQRDATEIARLNAALVAAEQEAADAQMQFTNQLAERDAQYARERSVLLASAQEFAATPEGRRYLQLVNRGDVAGWHEARSIFDQQEAAMERRFQLERAARLRSHAAQAADKHTAGQERFGYVLGLYERLVTLDDSQSRDWSNLAMMRLISGKLGAATEAFDRASTLALDSLDQLYLSSAAFELAAALGNKDAQRTELEQGIAHISSVQAQAGETAQLRWGQGYNAIGLSRVTAEAGTMELALSQARTAVQTNEDYAARFPEDMGTQVNLAASLDQLASVLRSIDRSDEALAVARRQLQLNEDLNQRFPDAWLVRSNLASAQLNFADQYVDDSDVTRRRELVDAAVKTFRQLTAQEPEIAIVQMNLATALQKQAQLLPDIEAAEAALDEALAIRQRHFDVNPEFLGSRGGVLSIQETRGKLYEQSGNWLKAASAFGAARALVIPRWQAGPTADTNSMLKYFTMLYATALTNAGDLLAAKTVWEELAEQQMDYALREPHIRDRWVDLQGTHTALIKLALDMGDKAKEANYIQRYQEISRDRLGVELEGDAGKLLGVRSATQIAAHLLNEEQLDRAALIIRSGARLAQGLDTANLAEEDLRNLEVITEIIGRRASETQNWVALQQVREALDDVSLYRLRRNADDVAAYRMKIASALLDAEIAHGKENTTAVVEGVRRGVALTQFVAEHSATSLEDRRAMVSTFSFLLSLPWELPDDLRAEIHELQDRLQATLPVEQNAEPAAESATP